MPEEKLPHQVQAPVAKDKVAVLENPVLKQEQAMDVAQAKARRNALIKELFRIAPQTHPPKPVHESPQLKNTTETVEEKDLPIQKTREPDLEEKRIQEQEMDRKMRTINGISLALYDYFSIDVNTQDMETIRRLQYLNSWVATEGLTFDEGLRSLHKADMKLGSSDTGNTKLIKLYNWVRFSRKK